VSAFATEFGKTLGEIVNGYRNDFRWVALMWHLALFILLYLILRFGNRYRQLHTLRLDLDLRRIDRRRLVVAVPMLIWGGVVPALHLRCPAGLRPGGTAVRRLRPDGLPDHPGRAQPAIPHLPAGNGPCQPAHHCVCFLVVCGRGALRVREGRPLAWP
jgi:hypothetical protein